MESGTRELRRLFEPITINGCEIRNRIVQPAQGTGFTEFDGTVTERLIAFHETKAKGGVGLIVFEATHVDPDGRISPIQPGLSADRFIPGFAALAERVHRHGARLLIQLCHHGRMSPALFTGVQPVGPSVRPRSWRTVHRKPHPYSPHDECRALKVGEIKKIVGLFADAAGRAQQAGADGVEIHGAHGYLISQFLSPLTNRRRDRYGRTPEGRIRLALEIIGAVRQRVGADFIVGFRLNGADYVENGMLVEEACWYARGLERAGIDLLNVSAGIYGSYPATIPPMWEPHGLFVHLARRVKKEIGIPVVGGGRIVDPLQAEDILRAGKADMVFMGRALMADPELPRKAAKGALDTVRRCVGCNQCLEIAEDIPDFGIHCFVNSRLGKESEIEVGRAPRGKRVLVAGGGPAGLKAAETAARRGHQVVLCERSRQLGGALRQVASVPGLSEYLVATEFLVRQLDRLGVQVRQQEVTPELVRELKPEAVIVATGAELYIPEIDGLERSRALMADAALSGDAEIGRHVLVQGEDLLAYEVADVLAQRGKVITIVEVPRFFPLDVMGVALSRFYLLSRLSLPEITFIKSPGIEAVAGGEVRVAAENGEAAVVRGVDTFVFAHRRPRHGLAAALRDLVPEVHVVGDAVRPRKSLQATYEGFTAGCEV